MELSLSNSALLIVISFPLESCPPTTKAYSGLSENRVMRTDSPETEGIIINCLEHVRTINFTRIELADCLSYSSSRADRSNGANPFSTVIWAEDSATED